MILPIISDEEVFFTKLNRLFLFLVYFIKNGFQFYLFLFCIYQDILMLLLLIKKYAIFIYYIHI